MRDVRKGTAKLNFPNGFFRQPLRDGEQGLGFLIDPGLLGGAGAAAQQGLDLAELVDTAELPRLRLAPLDQGSHRLRRRPLGVAGQVDELGLEAVASSAPLVLANE